jgi:hypothetical protein
MSLQDSLRRALALRKRQGLTVAHVRSHGLNEALFLRAVEEVDLNTVVSTHLRSDDSVRTIDYAHRRSMDGDGR